MLDVLYPHYQAPIPSMAIVQFEADTEQIKATTGYPIPPRTELETDPIGDEPCRFRTCYPVTLWPLEVKSATLMQPPFRAPNVRLPQDPASVLRLVISTGSKETPLASLGVRTLRFFLRGQPQHVFRLYELIFNNAIAVALAGSPDDADPILLGRDCLGQVGFERGEGLLEYPARSFLGYRLLTEFFAFPQKFLFVDLALPDLRGQGRWGDTFEVYVFLDRAVPDLGQGRLGRHLPARLHADRQPVQAACRPDRPDAPVPRVPGRPQQPPPPGARGLLDRPGDRLAAAGQIRSSSTPSSRSGIRRTRARTRATGTRRGGRRTPRPRARRGSTTSTGTTTGRTSTSRWSTRISGPRRRRTGPWTSRRPASTATCPRSSRSAATSPACG